MQSTTFEHNGLQAQGTLNEYEQHVRNGNDAQVKAIRKANPELESKFDHIDANARPTV